MSPIDLKAQRDGALKLVRVAYLARSVGWLSGAIAVAGVVLERPAPWSWLIALAINAAFWPSTAFLIAKSRRHVIAAEERNLVIDAALGGAWMAVMHFNVMPTAVLFATLTMDKLAFGGWPLLRRSLGAQILTAAATSLALGFPIDTTSSQAVMWACVPHLLIYPMLISNAAYSLLRRANLQTSQLAMMGRIDGLTGVFNRSHWTACAEQEMRRAKRIPMPASLLVVDLDHFKSINDRYGHASGDDVLKHVARLVKTGVREIDTVGRYGGDEFVVLLPNTDLATARSVAERIISLIRSSVSDGSSPVPYSVSIGVAQLDVGIDSLRDWFSRADRGLYSAKGLGRDQVIAPQQLAPESA